LVGEDLTLETDAPTAGASGEPAEIDARCGLELLADPKTSAATKSPEPSINRSLNRVVRTALPP
jgi:hypothetical protein